MCFLSKHFVVVVVLLLLLLLFFGGGGVGGTTILSKNGHHSSFLGPSSPGLGTSLPTIFAARALDGFFCGNMGATGRWRFPGANKMKDKKGDANRMKWGGIAPGRN